MDKYSFVLDSLFHFLKQKQANQLKKPLLRAIVEPDPRQEQIFNFYGLALTSTHYFL